MSVHPRHFSKDSPRFRGVDILHSFSCEELSSTRAFQYPVRKMWKKKSYMTFNTIIELSPRLEKSLIEFFIVCIQNIQCV